MANHAQVTLVGHLGKNPELRMTQSGVEICNFSLATSTGRDEHKKTTWWNVVAFKQTAKLADQYLKKGDPVMVVGEPYQEEWEDREGATRVTLKVNVNQLVLLGSKDDREAAPAKAAAPVKKPASNDVPFDDEIPF